MRRLLFILLLVALVTPPALIGASQLPLTIGIVAYRPKGESADRWQPLADYLSRELGGRTVRLQMFDLPGMKLAVEQGSINFVFCNPAHYVELRHQYRLSGALATVVEGSGSALLGGVVIARNDRSDLRQLADLKGKRLGGVAASSLAGYQAQALELKKVGVELPRDAELTFTGVPQDQVVEAVLAGHFDAGFVRSGVLEAMILEGKIKPDHLKVLNPVKHAGFTQVVSTALYPEWPFVALPNVDEELARRIAAALLLLELDGPLARQLNIHGFSIPADYHTIENLLLELRLPPFDQVPAFTLADIWLRYRGAIVLLGLTGVLIGALLLRLTRVNRRLLAARSAREAAAARLKTIFDVLPVGITISDRKGQIVDANRAAESIFGLTRAELLQRHCSSEDWQLLRRDGTPLPQHEYPGTRVLAEQSEVRNLEVGLPGPAGMLWLEVNAAPLASPQEGVVIACVDTTEEIAAEEALRQERDLLSKLFESSPNLLALVNEAGTIERINIAGAAFSGRPPDELLGQLNGEIFACIKALEGEGCGRNRECDHCPVRTRVQRALLDGVAILNEQGSLTILREGQPQTLHFLISVAPIFFFGRRKVLLTVTDISARWAMEVALLQARAAAEKANRAKSDFLANMSHEIRTPLNGVIGMAQLFSYTEVSAEQQEYLEAINLSAENLLALINDILDLSRIEADKVELDYAAFSLRRVIDDMFKIQKSRLYEKKLKFFLDIPQEVPDLLLGDQLRVKQIFLNLLSNAIKFTATGSITVTVVLREQQERIAILELAITDTGIGIDREALGKIFQPFVQANDRTCREYGGTGLGLAICTRLAELMGGGISAESEPGRGSTFRVFLPFELATTTGPYLARGHLKPLPKWDGPPLKVLIAEDNEVNRKHCNTLLRALGFDVTLARDGREALAIWQPGTYDLLLMDIQMPGLDGRETTAIIRQQEQATSHRTPIVALTAFALKDDRERFLGEGFDGYVAKPFKVEDLVVEMRRVLASEVGVKL